jgi:hypothetical protein
MVYARCFLAGEVLQGVIPAKIGFAKSRKRRDLKRGGI